MNGAERDRTVGLDNANVALSQLSYSPVYHGRSIALSFVAGKKNRIFFTIFSGLALPVFLAPFIDNLWLLRTGDNGALRPAQRQ